MLSTFKRQYLSDIGEFLANFNNAHPKKSLSQQKEIAKHERIACLRDQVNPISSEKSSSYDEKKSIWEGF